MIEHNISLIVDEELSHDDVKTWFKTVKENVPSGMITTVLVDGKPVHLVKIKKKSSVKYAIPLTRDLTERESKKIIETFSQEVDYDYRIELSSVEIDHDVTPEIKIDHEPLSALCTKWAKAKHDAWKKEKEDAGWRYGMSVSQTNKTHPLLRAWHELPDEHRKIDVEPVQELLDLLYDAGYVLVHNDDLNKLLGDF